jgi:hypothetical protein
MTINRILPFWLAGCVLAVVLFRMTAPAADPASLFTAERFSELHGLIRPQPNEEKWTQIHWLTSLWEARRQAAEAGKPILLWEMDGNPLGCT